MSKTWVKASGLIALICTLCFLGASWVLGPSPRQSEIAANARSCLGDLYDSSSFPGGPPPPGRGACVDVVYRSLLPKLDLQSQINKDIAQNPKLYPGRDNPELDYRWCPTQMIWFERYAESQTLEVRPWSALVDFQAGDIVFYDDGAGGPGHVGVVSDHWSWDGYPLLIHNPGPVCVEENALNSNRIVGHFRMED